MPARPDFKGATLGMRFDDLPKVADGHFFYEYPCTLLRDQHVTLGDRICTASPALRETIASVPAKHATMTWGDGVLLDIRVVISSLDFSTVAAALALKFGPPTSTRTETLRTGLGVEYQSSVHEWRVGDDVVEIEQRARRVDEGLVTFRGPEAGQLFERRSRERVNKGANDL